MRTGPYGATVYELFYSTGGHGGPYGNLSIAIVEASRRLRVSGQWIDIRPYDRDEVFGAPVARVHRTTAGENLVDFYDSPAAVQAAREERER